MAVIQYESDVSVRGRVLINGGLPHQFLKADGSLDSNTYALASSAHSPVTLGTANGLSLSTQQLSLGLASSGVTGALSGTDWNTFNGKFNTPTGLTTNYLPKWNGSGFGNSAWQEIGGRLTNGSDNGEDKLQVNGSGSFNGLLKVIGDGRQLVLKGSDQGAVDLYKLGTLGHRLYSDAGSFGIYDFEYGTVFSIAKATRAATFAGTITASPATTANQVVVMSQINSKANADGSNVSGTWGINISGNAASASFLPTKYDGGDRPNPQAYFTEYTGLRVAMTRSAWLGAWSDTLWINGYSGGDVPNMVAVHTIRNGQPRMWLSSQSNRATDYGTPYEVITDYNASSKVLRKGNDTNGGTYQLYSTNTGGGYSTRAIELRETNLVEATVISPEYAPAIGFHWSNLNQTKLMMRNDGQLAVSQNATDWGNPLIHSGNIGQQSVNYASTANSASAARYINIGTSASISDLNISANDHAVRFDTFDANAANKPISVDNANGVISFLMNHGPQYGKQIAFADNDDLYIRKLAAGTYGNWLSVIHSGNIGSQTVTYAANSSRLYATGGGYGYYDTNPYYMQMTYNYSVNRWRLSVIPTTPTAVEVAHSDNSSSAETIQGILPSQIVYGGVRASNNDNNLNNPNQKSGFYYTYGGVGAPTADWGNWITVAGSDWTTSNNYEFQLWHAFHSDDFYVRKMVNGSPDSWRRVIDSGNIGSQSVNYANSAGSAPNATNQNPSYLVTPGDGNGIKFWASDSYKISMGVGSLYQYGPVTDYSIKMQMDSGSPGRGFTWGREGNAPIAALNSTSGNFQTAGFVRSNRYYTDSNYYSLVGTDDNDSFGNPWYGIGRKNGSIVNLNGWSGINFRTNGATVAIDTGGNISTPGKMTLNSTAAGAGYWTAFVTNSRTALSSLTSGNGYGIFYYQGSSGRDGADSIDFAFNTTTSATSALSIKTNGDMKLAGAFTAGGKITAYSDKRLKTNIRDIENPLSGILRAKGVLYDRLDNDSKDQIGFLAQDLEEIFPELVITGLDGIKSVNYQAMTAILVEAIKEQQLQIDKLKS